MRGLDAASVKSLARDLCVNWQNTTCNKLGILGDPVAPGCAGILFYHTRKRKKNMGWDSALGGNISRSSAYS